MNIVVYEDNYGNFYPLVNLFPQFNLRIGMKTIAEHTALCFKRTRIHFIARPLFELKKVNPKGPTMYLSSRVLLAKAFSVPRQDARLEVGPDTIGLVKCKPPFPGSLEEIRDAVAAAKESKQVDGLVLNRIWDLIALNEEILVNHHRRYGNKSRVSKKLHIIGKRKNLCVARDADIHKQVCFDTSGGPIYVDSGAAIRPFSTIIGPVYIGSGTIVERAKIAKSSIGPYCRIGGEVEACIFQGYSNKYHEGFIGHSFIGEWVNLGALTTNSDLKNNYGPVRVAIRQQHFDTGMMKIGCFIGDHTKLGIGTLIPTGAVIGSFVNFIGGGLMSKYVSDFKWVTQNRQENYDLEKAISTAKVAMNRRNVRMSKQYERVIRNFHGQVRRSN